MCVRSCWRTEAMTGDREPGEPWEADPTSFRAKKDPAKNATGEISGKDLPDRSGFSGII